MRLFLEASGGRCWHGLMAWHGMAWQAMFHTAQAAAASHSAGSPSTRGLPLHVSDWAPPQVWQLSLSALAEMAAKGAVPKLKEQVGAPCGVLLGAAVGAGPASSQAPACSLFPPPLPPIPPSLTLMRFLPPTNTQGLQLCSLCLSYDFVGTCLDDASEELCTIQVCVSA